MEMLDCSAFVPVHNCRGEHLVPTRAQRSTSESEEATLARSRTPLRLSETPPSDLPPNWTTDSHPKFTPLRAAQGPRRNPSNDSSGISGSQLGPLWGRAFARRELKMENNVYEF